MELLKYICIGDRADIVVTDKNESEKVKNYSSKLIEIQKKNLIQMEAPISEGILVPLQIGKSYRIYFFSKGNIYLLKTKLISRQKTNENGIEISSLIFEVIGEIEKIQRRNYFRLDCSIDCKVRVIDQENKSQSEYLACIVKDLSAGGLRLLSNVEADEGSDVECIIKLDNYELFIVGKIVRNIKSNNVNYKRDLGLNFIDISNQNRDIIQKYIFDQQRKLRKKGMM